MTITNSNSDVDCFGSLLRARMLGGGLPVGKAKPDLGEVQETLLVPLYGRARDAAARRSILNDVRARELVDGIDYDFARFDRELLLQTVLRTAALICTSQAMNSPSPNEPPVGNIR